MGIFQSIGFKEFHDYLLLSKEEQESPKGGKMFEKGKELMMIATRQYARRQNKWIRQRFLRPERPSPKVYGVDSKDPSKWDEVVLKPAIELVQAVVDGKGLDHCQLQPVPLSKAYSYEESRQIFHCEKCDIDLRGKLQFEAHLKSRRHKSRLRPINKPDVCEKVPSEMIALGLRFSPQREVSKLEVWKLLREETQLPLNEIKAALERDEMTAVLRYPRRLSSYGGDKFQEFRERLIALGISEVNILHPEKDDEKCTS